MKRKLKTLTEQFTDAKSNYNRILGISDKQLMNEQRGGDKTNYSGTDGRSGVTLIPPKSRELQLKEQGNTPCTNGAYMTLEACPNSYHWTGTYIAGPWHCYCCTIDGNVPTQADVGTTIDYGPLNSSMGPNSYTVLSVSPGNPSNWQGSMNSTSACCVPAVQTMAGGCITPPSNGIGVNGRYVVLNNCDCDPTTGVGCYNPSGVSTGGATGGAWMAATICMTVDGGQVPQVGQTVNVPSSQNMTPGMVITAANTHPYCTADPGMGVNPGDPGTIGNFYDWSTMGPCTTTTACDTSTASPCAQQWFQNPNASWASTWITNRDCSNYTWPSTNLETQALSIMAGAPNPQPNVYNDWNDIWSAGQNSGLSPANAFIAKMAKAKYSQCQIQACNC